MLSVRLLSGDGPLHYTKGYHGARMIGRNGAPKEIRTPSLLIRSQMLYPVELWVLTLKGAAT